MKKIAFFILFCFGLSPAFGQWYIDYKVNNRAQQYYDGGIELLRNGEFDAGKRLLQRAVETDPKFVDAFLSLAGVHGELKNYDSAAQYYEQSFALDSTYTKDYYLPYSINLAGMGNFTAAKAAVERFLQLPRLAPRSLNAANYRLSSYNFAIDNHEKYAGRVFDPINLGDNINSARSEYYPSFTINDSMLVFTRRGEGFREDFIRSRKGQDGNYEKASLVQGSLNAEPSKGGLMISQDGQWLIFAGYFAQGFGDFDLYICYATPQGWSDPFNFGPAINTEFWESSPTLSPDKQALYFSSNRAGGFGGKDLYVSYRTIDGKWTPAENMGEKFNTAADELAPFIHADNQTLYFTSGGLPGYGGTDIFVSRKQADGTWGTPENLGYPINTIEDDGSLAVSADGKTAYFASDRRDTRGGLDLYRFELPEENRPLRTLWVQGTVMDSLTRKGLPSAIELKETTTGMLVQKVITDETGNYLVTLPTGHDYSFTVNRKGYLFYTDRIYLAEENASEETFTQDILLRPIEPNASFVMEHILFETNSYALDSTSNIELEKLVNWMQENPTMRIAIHGHTDNVGTTEANLSLSRSRARAVMTYLVRKGIHPQRITAQGFGESRPVAGNEDENGRALNRRTEIVVTSL